jgi:hypothetical protein
MIRYRLSPNTFRHVETLSDLAQRLPRLALKRNEKRIERRWRHPWPQAAYYRAIELYADDIVWRRLHSP